MSGEVSIRAEKKEMVEEAKGASRPRVIFVVVTACLLALNLVVLAAAYPETMRVDYGCCSNRLLAKDFSAFFTAAWRLVHDPSQVYTGGFVNDGEFFITPQPEAFKYLPSFLFMALPFTALPYQEALTAFDVFQFLLLPAIAYLVYELMKEKGMGWAVAVAAIALLLPSPAPGWSISVPYYLQWAEGQSKVLVTFLLLLSFYLGMRRRPGMSGIIFALAAFDPRFALVSIPLFVTYNRSNLRVSIAACLVALLGTNVALLYPPLGAGFLAMVSQNSLLASFYYYSLIPLLTVVAISLANAKEISSALRAIADNWARKPVPVVSSSSSSP
jgi:Glycosyltransferase family 87